MNMRTSFSFILKKAMTEVIPWWQQRADWIQKNTVLIVTLSATAHFLCVCCLIVTSGLVSTLRHTGTDTLIPLLFSSNITVGDLLQYATETLRLLAESLYRVAWLLLLAVTPAASSTVVVLHTMWVCVTILVQARILISMYDFHVSWYGFGMDDQFWVTKAKLLVLVFVLRVVGIVVGAVWGIAVCGKAMKVH